ncbi:MAG: TetR/AcrR family transcriptional regulator [Bacillota bacterium]|nr:TetR/AcrR family transcriptional regulator [Bacillota bacterium]
MSEASTKFQKTIMEAAIKLFKEKGYESVSVNDICKKAEIARSTFYINFSGKKDIIDMILNDVRLDRDDFFGDFVAAENDFERMWMLCNRYLTVAIDFGPELTGALFRLELMGELDVLDTTHKVDEWMIKLAVNSQKAGVILNSEPAEKIAPLGVDIAYYTTYEWCKRKGNFNLRQVIRRREESMYNLAPEYRMSDEELAKL